MIGGPENGQTVAYDELVSQRVYYRFGGQWIAVRENGELVYLDGDHLGSTSLSVAEAGTVLAERRYGPFGQERWVSGVEKIDFGYTGQRRNNDIKL